MVDRNDFAAQLDALDSAGAENVPFSQTAEELQDSPLYQRLRDWHAGLRQDAVAEAVQGSTENAQKAVPMPGPMALRQPHDPTQTVPNPFVSGPAQPAPTATAAPSVGPTPSAGAAEETKQEPAPAQQGSGVLGNWGLLTPEEKQAWLDRRSAEAKATLERVPQDIAASQARIEEAQRALDDLTPLPGGAADPFSETQRAALERTIQVERQSIAEAQDRKQSAETFLKNPGPGATEARWRNALENLVQSAASFGTMIGQDVSIYGGAAIGASNYPVVTSNNAARRWFASAQEYAQKQFPGDRARQDELLTKAAGLIGFYVPAYLLGKGAMSTELPGAIRAGARTTELTGLHASGAVPQYQAATDAMGKRWIGGFPGEPGARPAVSEDDRMAATNLGGALGLSMALPMERVLGAPAASTGATGFLKATGQSAGITAAQFAGFKLANDAITQGYIDPRHPIGEGLGDDALLGALFGTGVHAVREIINTLPDAQARHQYMQGIRDGIELYKANQAQQASYEWHLAQSGGQTPESGASQAVPVNQQPSLLYGEVSKGSEALGFTAAHVADSIRRRYQQAMPQLQGPSAPPQPMEAAPAPTPAETQAPAPEPKAEAEVPGKFDHLFYKKPVRGAPSVPEESSQEQATEGATLPQSAPTQPAPAATQEPGAAIPMPPPAPAAPQQPQSVIEQIAQALPKDASGQIDVPKTIDAAGRAVQQIVQGTPPQPAQGNVAENSAAQNYPTPTSQQVVQILPRDAEGYPDHVAFRQEMQKQFGKASWNELAPEQQRAIFDHFKQLHDAAAAEEIAPHTEAAASAIQDMEASGQTPEQHFAENPADPITQAVAEAVHEPGQTPEQLKEKLDAIEHAYPEAKAQIPVRGSGDNGPQGEQAAGSAGLAPTSEGHVGSVETGGSTERQPADVTGSGQPRSENGHLGDAERKRFDAILAGIAKRKDWAGQLGVKPEELAPYIEDGIARGVLRRDANGTVRRTPKAKEAPKVAGPEKESSAGSGKTEQLPEGISVDPATRITNKDVANHPEWSETAGRYHVIARREKPWSVVDGFGATPEEARADALRRLGVKPAEPAKPAPTAEAAPEPAKPEEKAPEAQKPVEPEPEKVTEPVAKNIEPADIEPEATPETAEGGDNAGTAIRDEGPQALEGVAPERVPADAEGRNPEQGRSRRKQKSGGTSGGTDAGGLPATRGGGSGAAATDTAAAGEGRVEQTPAEEVVERAKDEPALFEQSPSDEIEAASPINVPHLDFVIDSSVELGKGSEGAKYQDNLAAIRTLKQLEADGRRASPEEQRVLARYVGWGGLKNAFRVAGAGEGEGIAKGWEKRVAELEALLTPPELRAARNSTTAAHYTSQPVVEAMWRAAEWLGFAGGSVLEPAVGTGNFFGLMPQHLRGASDLMGVEYDSLTARIAQMLYPNAAVLHSGLQNVPLPRNQFALAIGNPPFGPELLSFRHNPAVNSYSIHNQFFMASMDALADDGVMAMVVSHNLMDALDPTARYEMATRAHFIGAVRLPDTAFKENARTEVVTDLMFFRKRSAEDAKLAQGAVIALRGGKPPKLDGDEEKSRYTDIHSNINNWVNSSKVNDPAGSGEQIHANDYFMRHPEMVVGKIDASGKMNAGRPELNVRLEDAAQFEPMLQAAIDRLPQPPRAPTLPRHRCSTSSRW